MRITSSGNVGIGTTSPTHELTVHSASNTAGTIEANRFSVRDNYGNPPGLGNGFYSPGANTTAFATNSTERMRIDSSGNVGIGNTSPTDKLHVGGNIRFGTNTTYYGVIEHGYGVTGANIYTSKDTGGHIFKTGTTPTERMRVTSDGKIRVKMSDFSSDPSASNSGLQLLTQVEVQLQALLVSRLRSFHAVFPEPKWRLWNYKHFWIRDFI